MGKVIQSIYERKGGMEEFVVWEIGGAWGGILKAKRYLDDLGIVFSNSFSRKVGVGQIFEF